MIEDYEAYEEAEEWEPSARLDEYFVEAQKDIRALFEEDRERIYYVRQLQVKFEKNEVDPGIWTGS